MPSQGPLNPTNAANAGAGVVWANLANCFSNDGSSSTVTPNVSVSRYLRTSQYAFDIPSTATIDGVLAEINRFSDILDIRDSELKLYVNGAESGTNKADTSTSWPLSDDGSYKSYGGASDTWGLALNPADINNTGVFGVSIKVQDELDAVAVASIDHIRMTVYYTLPVESQTSLFNRRDSIMWGSGRGIFRGF